MPEPCPEEHQWQQRPSYMADRGFTLLVSRFELHGGILFELETRNPELELCLRFTRYERRKTPQWTADCNRNVLEDCWLGRQCYEVTMIGDSLKILIGGQEGKPMPTTGRCNEKIDRAGIDAFRAA